MSRVAPPLNRFFIQPLYSIFYRRVKRLNWQESVRPDYALLVLLSGELDYQAGSNSGRLRTDEAVLLEPSTPLKAAGQNTEFVFLTLSPSFVLDFAIRMRLIGPAGNIGFPQPLVQVDSRLSTLATSFAAELSTEDAGREIVLQAGIEQLVVHLLRRFSNMRRSDELELSRVGLIDRRIRRAVELMHTQMDRDLSLKEIAAASYLSPFHFSRLFKKLTGASPHSYLATLRTRRAQLLLAETDLSITEISSRVGYATSSHFTKAFRQTTGLTPRAFRKAIVSR
jgi:AraC family transcriptional regulator